LGKIDGLKRTSVEDKIAKLYKAQEYKLRQQADNFQKIADLEKQIKINNVQGIVEENLQKQLQTAHEFGNLIKDQVGIIKSSLNIQKNRLATERDIAQEQRDIAKAQIEQQTEQLFMLMDEVSVAQEELETRKTESNKQNEEFENTKQT